jgi:hypothetical protein
LLPKPPRSKQEKIKSLLRLCSRLAVLLNGSTFHYGQPTEPIRPEEKKRGMAAPVVYVSS